jgi:hypothetical protein
MEEMAGSLVEKNPEKVKISKLFPLFYRSLFISIKKSHFISLRYTFMNVNKQIHTYIAFEIWKKWLAAW